MNLLDKLEKNEIKELLNKCWMTHDAMWFANCLQEFGIEKTNKINRAAVKGMASVEIKRIKKIAGINEVKTFEELKDLIGCAFDLVKADFMKGGFTSPSENVLHWEMTDCWAHNGIKNMGVIDQYQCGVLERIKAWCEELGVEYTMKPELNGCLMFSNGRCSGDFIFSFDN